MEKELNMKLSKIEFQAAETDLKIKNRELEILNRPWYKNTSNQFWGTITGALATGLVTMFLSFTEDLSNQSSSLKRQVIENLSINAKASKIPESSLDKYLINYSVGYVTGILNSKNWKKPLDEAIASGDREKVLEVYKKATAKMMKKVTNGIN